MTVYETSKAVRDELQLDSQIDEVTGWVQPPDQPAINNWYWLIPIIVNLFSLGMAVYFGHLIQQEIPDFPLWISASVFFTHGLIAWAVLMILGRLETVQDFKWTEKAPRKVPFTLNTQGLKLGDRFWRWRSLPPISASISEDRRSFLKLHPKDEEPITLVGSSTAMTWLLAQIEGFTAPIDKAAKIPDALHQLRNPTPSDTRPTGREKQGLS